MAKPQAQGLTAASPSGSWLPPQVTSPVPAVLLFDCNVSSIMLDGSGGYVGWQWGWQKDLPHTHTHFHMTGM